MVLGKKQRSEAAAYPQIRGGRKKRPLIDPKEKKKKSPETAKYALT